MHFSSVLKFVAVVAPIFAQSASGWNFTAYDAEGCGETANIAADTVEKTGNVECELVPNAAQHKSIQGSIPSGSECRLNFYPREGCGDKVAFALTQYSTKCFSISDFTSPLQYYKATDCE
ncbi:hypothetical protein GGR52DRAFT_558140 [Hypoxylon sp. FL1284]|nr:hypothetical protein GGR52DRAFT_558140 [Hypoxylon sp. FL1284]